MSNSSLNVVEEEWTNPDLSGVEDKKDEVEMSE
eukprot:CAMPEP_0170568502 /NCGR_PEP_ID=MMETSP0211-20121228/81243_1 /TAXON_ID=311385 /ORGANISM="Pseudokeronopsis sp., Strain OXSARD2" /LENGTH=32 /DNA_ID= /DNA_START= /DNA_END= /DNA_ORIENTATION=